jgi:hypothetical protein
LERGRGGPVMVENIPKSKKAHPSKIFQKQKGF